MLTVTGSLSLLLLRPLCGPARAQHIWGCAGWSGLAVLMLLLKTLLLLITPRSQSCRDRCCSLSEGSTGSLISECSLSLRSNGLCLGTHSSRLLTEAGLWHQHHQQQHQQQQHIHSGGRGLHM